MAEEKAEKKKEKKKDSAEKEASLSDKVAGKSGLFTWIFLGAVTLAGATGGFALSQLMGGTDAECPAAEEVVEGPGKGFDEYLAQNAEEGNTWIYEKLETVVANLDEPGVTRYVRATVTLEMSSEMDPKKGETFLDEKKLLLQDWLTTYFAGLGLDDVRGTRNLGRIKREIQDEINKLLFPKGRPFVRRILFKDFAVQ